MRPPHGTVTPPVVRTTARRALREALPWRGYGRLVAVDLPLLAASLVSSPSAVARRFGFGPSRETARTALDATLPGLDPLTGGLVDSLYLFGPREAVVPQAVRGRDELPAGERGRGEDDEGGRGVPATADRAGSAVGAGEGVADGAGGARRGLRPTRWPPGLPPARMAEWLADLLKGKCKEGKEIRLGSPPLPLAAD